MSKQILVVALVAAGVLLVPIVKVGEGAFMVRA